MTTSASKSFCQRYTARLKCSDRNGTSRDVNESRKITARGSDGSSISVTSRPSSSVGLAPAGSSTRARRGRFGTSVMSTSRSTRVSPIMPARSSPSIVRSTGVKSSRDHAGGVAGTRARTALMICWYATSAPRSFQCVSVCW